MPGDVVFEPEYVAARHVLLDVLAALDEHRKSLVLVGAQAIYMRIGDHHTAELAVAPYTTDADLVIDPRGLVDEPNLVAALRAARFELVVRPGTWALVDSNIHVDFMVPAELAGSGRRGARLGPHGNDVARQTTGLEAAVVDRANMRVTALDSTDKRFFDVAVAGLPALLVAKLHKLADRRDELDRLSEKDALDVLRILQRLDKKSVLTLAQLSSDIVAGDVTRKAREHLASLFSQRSALGAVLAARAVAGLGDEEEISISCEALARGLLLHWR